MGETGLEDPASKILCDLLCGKLIAANLDFIEEMVPAKRVVATIHVFKKSCDLLCAKRFAEYPDDWRQIGTAKRVAEKKSGLRKICDLLCAKRVATFLKFRIWASQVDPGQGLIVAKGTKSWPPSISCDLLCAKRVATFTPRSSFFATWLCTRPSLDPWPLG